MLTNFSRLTTYEKTVWARKVWRQGRTWSFFNNFMGEGADSMIQRITELKRDEKGARAVITLVADLVEDGVAGDRTLEGNEEAMTSFDQVIRIDQLRHAVRHEGRMANQKSVVEFRGTAKNNLVLARAAQRKYDLPVLRMTQTERAELLYSMALAAIKQGDVAVGKGLLNQAIETHPQYFEAAARSLEALDANVKM